MQGYETSRNRAGGGGGDIWWLHCADVTVAISCSRRADGGIVNNQIRKGLLLSL